MSEMIATTTMGMPNVNVRLVCRNVRTGETTRVIETHNRVLKFALYGLIRFINGEFNTSTPLQIQDYIPRYLALGSNIATGTNSGGVTSEVTVNDTRLLSELNHPRTRLTQRNIITNRYNDPYIKLTIKHYIPVTAYVGESLAEAGLFTEETGNNAWARITFDRFIKDEETVIDITWEITIVSIASEKEAYVSIDKSLLYSSITDTITLIRNHYPNLKQLCANLNKGILDYGKSDVSQKQIDEDTRAIQESADPFPE